MGIVDKSRKPQGASPEPNTSFEYETSEEEMPTDFEVIWCNFPDSFEAGLVSAMFDRDQIRTSDKDLAVYILAIDRYGDLQRFEKEDDTFGTSPYYS